MWVGAYITTKLSDLKLKTGQKQLLGFLISAFALPSLLYRNEHNGQPTHLVTKIGGLTVPPMYHQKGINEFVNYQSISCLLYACGNIDYFGLHNQGLE